MLNLIDAQTYKASPLEVQFAAQIETARLPEPKREYKLCGHKVDFAWDEYKICVEIQGATWTRGAHTRGKGYAKDRMLSNERQIAGWICLEFTSDHLNADAAIPIVRAALTARE